VGGAAEDTIKMLNDISKTTENITTHFFISLTTSSNYNILSFDILIVIM